jgi:hypothetical protein
MIEFALARPGLSVGAFTVANLGLQLCVNPYLRANLKNSITSYYNRITGREHGFPAANICARDGNLEKLRNMKNIESKDKYRNTPLRLAALQGHMNVVRYLVEERKANMEVVGSYYHDLVTLVEEFGTPIFSAAQNKHWDIVQYLVERGANYAGLLEKFPESETAIKRGAHQRVLQIQQGIGEALPDVLNTLLGYDGELMPAPAIAKP